MSMAANSPRKHSNHIRHTRNDRCAKVIAYLIVGLFGLICLYPLLLKTRLRSNHYEATPLIWCGLLYKS